MGDAIDVRYTGLDEIADALKELGDWAVLRDIEEELRAIGDIVRDDARHRFTAHFAERPSARSAASVAHTAAGFETRVRGFTIGHSVSVYVGQRLRSVTGKRGDWGEEMMWFGLLPARHAHHNQAVALLEETVAGTLHDHGF